jgi:hypothetical protein
VNLRRATSSAYDALFHCLARSCADLLVGGAGADRSKHAWKQVYRAVEHGAARKACEDGGVITRFPRPIEDFANAFVLLQSKRHAADYDPSGGFTKSDVTQDVATAAQVIGEFASAPVKDRRAFCTFVLFKKRG